MYGEEEHEERATALRARRDEEFDRIEGALTEAEEEARTSIAEFGHGDPTAWLSRGELDEANRRRGFVAEDVASLPVGDLVERLGAVLRGGDRASMFVHWRAAERRLQGDEEDKRGQLRRRGLPTAAAVPNGALAEACADLRAELEGEERRRRVPEAEERLREAARVRSLAWSLRRGAKTVAGVQSRQVYRRPVVRS